MEILCGVSKYRDWASKPLILSLAPAAMFYKPRFDLFEQNAIKEIKQLNFVFTQYRKPMNMPKAILIFPNQRSGNP